LSRDGIPVEISNCAFFKEGLVPDIVGSLVLILAVVIFDAANEIKSLIA